jgi:hypothetical protein
MRPPHVDSGVCVKMMKYVLHDWIDPTSLNPTSACCHYLSQNRNAVDFLKEHPHLIDFEGLCLNRNPDVIPLIREYLKSPEPKSRVLNNLSRNRSVDVMALLEEHEDLQNWTWLSANPFAMRLIELHPDKINWKMFLMNPKAEKIVTEWMTHFSTKDLKFLSHNRSKWAVALIEKHLDAFDAWDELSGNPFAINLLERHKHRINIERLCFNPNPKATELLLQHPDFSWDLVSVNPGAINLLKRNLDKINWNHVSMNPNAFELFKEHHEKMQIGYWWRHPWIFHAKYDYAAIRTCREDLHKELMAVYYHPSRMDFETGEADATRSVFSSKKRRRDPLT